ARLYRPGRHPRGARAAARAGRRRRPRVLRRQPRWVPEPRIPAARVRPGASSGPGRPARPRHSRRRPRARAPRGACSGGGGEPRRLGCRAGRHRGDLSSGDGAGRAPARARCVSGMIGMEPRPRVAITMGDAAGIGPEIIVRSLADPVAATWAVPVVLGDARVLERAMDVAGVRLSLRRISRPGEAEGRPGTLDVVDYANIDLAAHRWGEVRASNGAAAVHYTREAGRFALAGDVDAMVSAPLNKEAMHAAGYPYEGQTEILGELTGSRPAMVMVVDRMRVMLFTNHMALRAVCDYVRKDRVLDRLVL